MNSLKTVFLMTAMMVLLLIVGSLLGGETGLIIAFIISLALNFGSYWYSDKIVLKMYKAKEISRNDYPQYYDLVRDLSERAGLPMPKVYVVNNPSPNAFATGRNPDNAAVAVTTGILNILNKNELGGVISHELTHVKNRDILISTITATLVGTITFIARLAGCIAIFGGDDEEGGGLSAIAMMILAPIIAMMLQFAISRSREYMADEGGARISGEPLSLASALDKLTQASKRMPKRRKGTESETATAHMFIVNPLSGSSMMKLFSTHPPMEERIKRLQELAQGRREYRTAF